MCYEISAKLKNDSIAEMGNRVSGTLADRPACLDANDLFDWLAPVGLAGTAPASSFVMKL